jgi:purine-binding chemotaxis protein CheW
MATFTATPNSESAQAGGQFSTFFVADLFFGVDVLHVQEVLRAQQMTAVPQAPDVIEGLINLRGQIVTAIDMRRRLLLPPREGDEDAMNMVVRTADGAVSLLVDEIGDVLDLDAGAYERPPENLDPAARDLISGVYRLKDQLLLVLDTERAVEVGNLLAPRETIHDAPPAERSSARRRARSRSAEALAPECPEPAPSQSPARKTVRKAPGKKSSSAARGTQASSG